MKRSQIAHIDKSKTSKPGVHALRGFEWQRHVCYQSLDSVEIADNESALP